MPPSTTKAAIAKRQRRKLRQHDKAMGRLPAPAPKQMQAQLKKALTKAQRARTADTFADAVAAALRAIGAAAAAELARVEARHMWKLIEKKQLTRDQAFAVVARRAGDLQMMLLNALKTDTVQAIKKGMRS